MGKMWYGLLMFACVSVEHCVWFGLLICACVSLSVEHCVWFGLLMFVFQWSIMCGLDSWCLHVSLSVERYNDDVVLTPTLCLCFSGALWAGAQCRIHRKQSSGTLGLYLSASCTLAQHCYSVVFHISCSAVLFCCISYFMLSTVVLLYFIFHAQHCYSVIFHWYSVLCWAVTSVSVTSVGCLPTRHTLGVTNI